MGRDAGVPTSRGGEDNPELREIRAFESKLQATEQELESIKRLMTSQQRDDQVRQTKIRDFCEIGHVNEYPTMHYFEIPRDTQSMVAYTVLTE